MERRAIGILMFDGVQGLDVVGPHDAFDAANAIAGTAAYDVRLIGRQPGPVRAEGSLQLVATHGFADAGPLDTILVPGGVGTRDDREAEVDWLRSRVATTRRLGSVCTGTYVLARTGALDGHDVTTHWGFAGDLRAAFPKLRVRPDAIFLRRGGLFTAAGVTAGIDVALELIEEDLGRRVAVDVARHLVVYVRRPGDQSQFSSALELQADAPPSFADLAAWAMNHPEADLSVEAMAARVGVGERHFRRRFAEIFGETPARWVERLRLELARQRLIDTTHGIAAIAEGVGFRSADVFRRAFARRFGTAPATYRQRFTSSSGEVNRA